MMFSVPDNSAVIPGHIDQQDQMYDPYALPVDPYLQNRPSNNMNIQVMTKLFDSSLSAIDISNGEYEVMLRSIGMDLRRSPNTPPTQINKWVRDFRDIEGLMKCSGTKGRVRSRMRILWFEVNAQAGDGSAPLNGLTGVSAMITQKTQSEQQVKIPQAPERKKIFGLI